MSALDIFKSVTLECVISVPSATVIASDEREHRELVSLSEMAAEDIIRRGDWPRLRNAQTFTADGVSSSYSLPAGFMRLVKGSSVTVNNIPLRGGLTDGEWVSLPASDGAPRYYHVRGNSIELWPRPAASTTFVVNYYSNLWCVSGGNPRGKWEADSDTTVIPEILLVKGTIYRWKRLKGLAFADHQAEYEESLMQYAEYENGGRTP